MFGVSIHIHFVVCEFLNLLWFIIITQYEMSTKFLFLFDRVE
jgi:hypothetical protein